MRHSLRVLFFALLICAAGKSVSAGSHASTGPVVPLCTGITLAASYLSETAPNAGPGFLFRVENHTAKVIRLEQPVPSSAHWYAMVGDRWLWRASAGRGGALVDALRQRGPLFAYRPAEPPIHPSYITVPAHGVQEWRESMRDNPAIEYKPSCAMCNYPGEREYEAVFAYAYLPNPQEQGNDLLRCGLRSDPVPMPPAAVHSGSPDHASAQ